MRFLSKGLQWTQQPLKVLLCCFGLWICYQSSQAQDLGTKVAQYNGTALTINTGDLKPMGLTFNNDGTKLYVAMDNGDALLQYTLETAWDIGSADADNVVEVSTNITNAGIAKPQAIRFNSDGSKLFVLDSQDNDIYTLDLGTNFDITTITAAANNEFSTTGENTTERGLAFSATGDKLFFSGNSANKIFQFNLTTNFDLSTAPSEADQEFTTTDTSPEGLMFSADGMKLFIVGSGNDNVYQHNLTTAYDLSTASATADFTFDLSTAGNGGETTPRDIFITENNIYVSGESTNPDRILQYDLVIPEAAGDIIVTEIMNDPTLSTNANGQFFEIYNTTDNTIDLDGWTLSDDDTDSHTIDNGGPLEIASGAYMVFGTNSDMTSNGGTTIDYVYSGFTLDKGPDEIILTSDDNVEINKVAYDDGTTFPNPSGASLSLTDLTIDNNVGSSWASATTFYGDGDLGTPGAENSFNGPPTVTGPLSDQSVIEGFGSAEIDAGNVFTDAEGNDLNLEVSSSDESVVTVSINPNTDIITITEVGDGTANITITAEDGISDGTASDTFEFEVINNSSATWTGSVDSDWNNTGNWSTGRVPTSVTAVRLEEVTNQPVIESAVTISTLTNRNSSNNTLILTINSGYLQIRGSLENTGKIEVEPGASLSAAVRFGNGSEIIKMALPDHKGFRILSNPYQNFDVIDYDASIVYEYDNDRDQFSAKAGGSAAPGKGWFVHYSTTGTFTPPRLGINAVSRIQVNSVSVAVETGRTNFNLVGNPYASAISAAAFFNNTDNSTNTTGTAYLWNDGGSNVGDTRGGDYLAVNSMGVAGSAVAPTNDTGVGGLKGSANFNGNFNTWQGFFIEAEANGNVTFTPDMQVHGGNVTDELFRGVSQERGLLRLSLSGNDSYNDLLIGLDPKATFEADYSMDARKFSGNEFISFYALQQDEHYAIAALPLVEDAPIELPLGVSTSLEGKYLLKAEQLEGFAEDITITLLDQLTGMTYDLRETREIAVDLGNEEVEDRWKVVFSSKSFVITEVDEPFSSEQLKVYANTNRLKVWNAAGTDAKAEVFSFTGQLLYSHQYESTGEAITIDGIPLFKGQLYVLRIGQRAVKFTVLDE